MEIEVMNPAPTYAKLIDVINPEFSAILIDLVKEKGIKSNYSTNLNCREYKLPNVFTGSMSKEDVRVISNLHAIVEPIQALANEIFKNTAMSKIITHAGFWLMEYSEGGSFGNHVDFSTDDDEYSTVALATLAINLNDNAEYGGGEFSLSGKILCSSPNSGYLWDGWTYHEVAPVTEGKRYVLVVHFTGFVKE